MAAQLLATVDGVFKLTESNCKIGTVRTVVGVIFENDSLSIKLDDQ